MLAIIVVLCITPIVLLHFNSIQNLVADRLTELLGEKLQTKVTIGHVDFRPFNRLTIDYLYISDQRGDTLAAVSHIDATFSLRRIIDKELSFKSLHINDPDIRLKQHTDGSTNIQFLIDLLRPDNPQPMSLLLHLTDIEVTGGRFAFNRDSTTHNAYRFDPNHIQITDLHTRIDLDTIADHYYSIRIRQLGFMEQSGFELTNLYGHTRITDSCLQAPLLTVQLPSSNVQLHNIHLHYAHLNDIASDLQHLLLEGCIQAQPLMLNDLAAFEPKLDHLQQPIRMTAAFSGRINNLHLDTIAACYGSDITMNGRIGVRGLPDIDTLAVDGEINQLVFNIVGLQDLVANLTRQPLVLPKNLQNLGQCTYSGAICGPLSNVHLTGLLHTAAGNINTDVNMRVNNHFANLDLSGCIRSNKLNLKHILNDQLGVATFDIDATLNAGADQPFYSNIKANIASIEFRGYEHKNIQINGNIRPHQFDGHVHTDDPYGQLDFDGNIDLSHALRTFDFKARINDFSPYAMHLTETYPDLKISLLARVNFSSEQIEHLDGNILIDSLLLQNGQQSYLIDSLYIRSQAHDEQYTTIESPLLSGNFSGDYRLPTLPGKCMDIVTRYMPLIKHKTNRHNDYVNNLRFFFTIAPTDTLCRVLDIPLYTTESSLISGFYSDEYQSFNVEVDVPHLYKGMKRFDNTNLHAYNTPQKIILEMHTDINSITDTLSTDVTVAMSGDTIRANALWKNTKPDTLNAGEFVTQVWLFRRGDSLNANVHIFPTEFYLLNQPYEVSEADIKMHKEHLSIHHFLIASNNQKISIDGTISKKSEEKLHFNLENINLDYIFSMISMSNGLTLGGHMSGTADVGNLFDTPLLEANVTSPDFTFNNVQYGLTHAVSKLDMKQKRINFKGTVQGNRNDSTVILYGFYNFDTDSLDMHGIARSMDMSFINSFTQGILNNIQGRGTGQVHIYGLTKHGITVTADAMVRQGQIGIDYLNTTYFFEDSIRLTPTTIEFRNIDLRDQEDNHALLNGLLTHQGFKNLHFDIDLKCKRLLIFDLSKQQGEIFYGRGYVSGTGKIAGDDHRVNINCNIRTEPNTHIIIPLESAISTAATDNTFITFVDRSTKPDTTELMRMALQPATEQVSNLGVKLLIETNQNAELQLIIDQKTGDIIQATGDGNLRMEYDPVTDAFKMYGNYVIANGSYMFSFQEALRREFKIKDNSEIRWTGNPAKPTLNIKAYYQLNASLSDILPADVLQNMGRTIVPVQCLLTMTGDLEQPTLSFDLNLPNSDQELNSALKSAVHTDEEMRRQIVYLLVLGKFQSVNANNSAVLFGQDELLSVVSSTVSAQLNHWASQLFDNWNFGVNFRSEGDGEARSNEYEVQMLYAPNDRLTFNGNFGYRDRTISTNESRFIGDFDVIYNLLQSGRLSLKAYTHTNDYREFKEGPTTQGLGIIYHETFNSLKELYKERREYRAELRKKRDERRRVHALRKKQKTMEKKATKDTLEQEE